MNLGFFIGQLVETDIVEQEFKKSVKKLEANNIVFGKSKKEMQYTWFTARVNKKVAITIMISSPTARDMLVNSIKKLIEEGNLIFNTNIPHEILNLPASD